MRVHLNQKFIENNLQCPPDRRKIEFTDRSLPGFLVEVTSSSPGVGAYRLRYRDSSNLTRYASLGRTDVVALDDARQAAQKLKAKITLGADPSADKKAANAVLTFADFFTEHYLPFAKQRKRTWKRDEEIFDRHLKPQFGHRKLNAITRAQIQAFHTGMKAEGLAGATCDHPIKLLRRCLNLTVEWGMIDKNPAAGFKLFNEDNKVENYLDEDQLQRLLKVLRTDKNRTVCNIALWLLSTGARLNEALQARWDLVDKANRVWRISAATSKSKRVRSVPLNDAAIEVLNSLDTKDKFDYLFINRKTKKPYTTVHKVWERLRIQAGLPHLRVHDLRHSYASFLVNSGRSLYEVQQILGHSQPQVTQRYSHLSTKTLQDAASAASAVITRSGKPPASASR